MRCDGFSGSSPAPVTGAAATCNSILCLPGRAGWPELISPQPDQGARQPEQDEWTIKRCCAGSRQTEMYPAVRQGIRGLSGQIFTHSLCKFNLLGGFRLGLGATCGSSLGLL